MRANVVALGAGELEEAAGVLARAFHDDPLTGHLFPDGGARARLAPLMFTALARYDYLFGQVDRLAAGFSAVATWLRPGERAETPERLAEAGFDDLSAQVGEEPLERLAAFYGAVENAHERATPLPHWYLRLLGVEPGHQGRGLGSTLLTHGLARADATGHACFLETFQERNVRFYLRHGFDLVVDELEPETGIRIWGFLRAAKPQLPQQSFRTRFKMARVVGLMRE
jgi:GNAT superfamily N-acetyltransferase